MLKPDCFAENLTLCTALSLAVLAVGLLGPGVDVVVAYSDRGCFVSAATTPPPKLASAAAFGCTVVSNS
mgnify:CR=1 FL=1